MASERDTWQHCPTCTGSVPAGRASCPNCRRQPVGGGSVPPSSEPGSSAGSDSGGREPDLEATSTRSGLPPMRLGRGTRVSVYRIESVLGEGGMGVVYKAWDEAVGRHVALKCLHTNLAGDPDIRRRFAREARVLRSYRHPNVIQVYDFVEFDYLL